MLRWVDYFDFMKHLLRTRIGREFEDVVIPLCALLSADGVTSWLDSGTLLGMCRDLHPPSWDKDFDIAIWDYDFDKVLASLQSLKLTNPSFLYYTIQVKYLKGKPYAILLIQPGRVPKTFKHLPIAIHIFSKSNGLAVSPQPHSLRGLKGAYSRAQLLNSIPQLRRSVDSNLLRYNSLYIILALQPKLFKYFIALVLIRLQSITSIPMRTYIKFVRKFRLSKERVPYLDPDDEASICIKQSSIEHHYRHLCESFWGRWLYEMLVWKVPLKYFESLSPISTLSEQLPESVLMPTLNKEYLTKRYGDWQVPASDWVYVLQDGCIFPESSK